MNYNNKNKHKFVKLFSFMPFLLLIPAYITNLFTEITRDDAKVLIFLSICVLLFILIISVLVTASRIVKQLKKLNDTQKLLLEKQSVIQSDYLPTKTDEIGKTQTVEVIEDQHLENSSSSLLASQEAITESAVATENIKIAETYEKEQSVEVEEAAAIETAKEEVLNEVESASDISSETVIDAEQNIEAKEENEITSTSEKNVEESDDSAKLQENNESDDDDDAIRFGGLDEVSGLAIAIRLNKSYTAKLMQTDDETKRYYEQIKNAILSYGTVKSKISFQHEIFSKGRRKLIKFFMRGKTFCIYYALDPSAFENTHFKVEDVSDQRKHVETPCLFRIKNARRAQYAIELVKQLMNDNGIEFSNEANEHYVDMYPYKSNDELIKLGLVKEVETKVSMENLTKKYGDITKQNLIRE